MPRPCRLSRRCPPSGDALTLPAPPLPPTACAVCVAGEGEPQGPGREKMAAKYKEKGTAMPQEEFDAITREVSTASMKYALLSASCATKINSRLVYGE